MLNLNTFARTGLRRFSNVPHSVVHSDVLVIGSGVAGCSAALTLAKQGFKVSILSASKNPLHCNSYWAQGGIIYKGLEDTPELLAQDVHYAGAGICQDEAVMQLAKKGPSCVEDLLMTAPFVVPFDRDASGDLSLCLEASHNRARIVHWKDQTGRAITETLLQASTAHPNIDVLPSRTALDLLVSNPSRSEPPRCIGARVANQTTQQAEHMIAPYTVLATGGLGEIFQHTSNHPSARGDGIAMAYRAGAKLQAMEYVQFHPTTFYFEGERSFLLTEALRGEGARLLNHEGHFFATDYDPAGELAPRDVVSRMIMSELEKLEQKHVWLDISHKNADWIRGRFPTIYEHCLERGFDMTKVPLPVVPAAHYFCGGVQVDLNGATSIDGLYAGGEVSCTGLHGANRLASTSLLEGLVWGKAIGKHIASNTSHLSMPSQAQVHVSSSGLSEDPVPPGEVLDRYWIQLKHIMWEYVGITRSPQGLDKARRMLYFFNTDLQSMREKWPLSEEVNSLANAVQTALLVTRAARKNKESRGTHYILDEDYSFIGGPAFREPVQQSDTFAHRAEMFFGEAHHKNC